MTTSIRLEYGPDEKPEYAFCESVHAGPLAPWHIRKLSDTGLKLRGGIDTPSLCGRVRPFGDESGEHRGTGGWDLRVRILPRHFAKVADGVKPICCTECARRYPNVGTGEP